MHGVFARFDEIEFYRKRGVDVDEERGGVPRETCLRFVRF